MITKSKRKIVLPMGTFLNLRANLAKISTPPVVPPALKTIPNPTPENNPASIAAKNISSFKFRVKEKVSNTSRKKLKLSVPTIVRKKVLLPKIKYPIMKMGIFKNIVDREGFIENK